MLRGTVTDPSGDPLPGAIVTASNDDTGVERSAVTDGDGSFTLSHLAAATYTVRADLAGFAPRVREAQALYVGTAVTVDFQLAVAGVAETVTVRGALALLETTRHTLSRIVQKEEIDALPVVDRNFNDLAALAPGVTKTGLYGGVDISGSRDFQNGYQLDGVSAERQHLGDQRVAYAQDWVQEFQVLTSQFNAEFGQASGGVLNAITRSGTNRLEARVYGFFRDDAWDATPQFIMRKPALDEHRLGGTIGGPIVPNRLFYFGGFERLRTTSSSIVNSTFPTANGAFPANDDRRLSLVKIDGYAAPAHTFRFRYNNQRQQTTGASIGGISTEEHGRFSDVSADDVVGGWTWIAAATTMNETRVAWNAMTSASGCNYASRNPPGTWFERAYPGASFGCPVNFGTIAEDQFQVIDNLIWVRQRHEIKFGAHAVWTRSSGDFRNFRDGRYSFERDIPFNPENPASYPFSFVMIEGPTAWNLSHWSAGLFVQDSWRITDDLALNAGVRYDIDHALTALNPLVRPDRGRHAIGTDLGNVAPRVGAAWTPFENGRRTLLRGGVGLYYDQNHNNAAATVLLNNILVDRIVALSANNPLLNPFWPDAGRARALLAGALAHNAVPDASLLGSVAGSTNDVDPDLQIPATTQVSGGVMHEFSRWANLSADVVYARGFDLYVMRDTNIDPVTLQRIDPNFTSIIAVGNGGISHYKALHLQGSIVPASRHFLKFAYTWATNRSNTTTTLSGGAATNPFDYSEDEGPADNDVRHSASVNLSSLLPFDVRVSGILSVRSALPYSATTNAPRPDGRPFGFRPEPRNARRGDGALSLDVRLEKVITLTSRRSASAFVELFNLTNTPNHGNYIGTITSSRFGQPTTAGPNRRLQLGFRVDF